MLEIDLIATLESRYNCKVFPVTITEGEPYPIITYKETNNKRNSNSSLRLANLRDQSFTITFISDTDVWVFENKDNFINYFEMYSGLLGATKIFTTTIDSARADFDNTQRIYKYSIDVTFTKHV